MEIPHTCNRSSVTHRETNDENVACASKAEGMRVSQSSDEYAESEAAADLQVTKSKDTDL